MADITLVTIEAKVLWRAKRSDKSYRWVGVCDELNLSTEAESLDELDQLIPEAMDLLFQDLLEDGEFDQYLTARGWSAGEIPAAAPGGVEFDVPWEILAEGQKHGAERRRH